MDEERTLDESRPGNPWPTIALVFGVLAGVGIGVVAVLLFLRKTRPPTVEELFPNAEPPPRVGPLLAPMLAAPPAPPRAPSPPARPKAPRYPDARPLTTVNTRQLPSLSVANSQAIRVAASDEQPVRVSLRPIGPPGSFAVFSQSPGELNVPGLPAAIPTGFVFTIPVGDTQTVDLHKKQALFAKGNVPGVRLSITTALVPAEY